MTLALFTPPAPARPLLKWVGGKTQLLPVIDPLIPRRFGRYFEPFMGGGAVFWHVASTRDADTVYLLNDRNTELVNLYEVVREETATLRAALDALRANPAWNSAEQFASMRASVPEDPVARAARMVYLNKTCFDGLYRVNRAGQFNTPHGRYANPSLYDADNLAACSRALRWARLTTGDFEDAVHGAGTGDVVYFDPPYVPLTDTANFASYTAGGFGSEQQARRRSASDASPRTGRPGSSRTPTRRSCATSTPDSTFGRSRPGAT